MAAPIADSIRPPNIALAAVPILAKGTRSALGSRRLDTLMDLLGAHRVQLVAHCEGCGHRARLNKAGLVRRYGLTISLLTIRRKLKCTRCGERLASYGVE
jgi:hypothetical protein